MVRSVFDALVGSTSCRPGVFAGAGTERRELILLFRMDAIPDAMIGIFESLKEVASRCSKAASI